MNQEVNVLNVKAKCLELAVKCVKCCEDVKMLTAAEYAKMEEENYHNRSKYVDFFKENDGNKIASEIELLDDDKLFDMICNISGMMIEADNLSFWKGKNEEYINNYKSEYVPQYLIQQREFQKDLNNVEKMMQTLSIELETVSIELEAIQTYESFEETNKENIGDVEITE